MSLLRHPFGQIEVLLLSAGVTTKQHETSHSNAHTRFLNNHNEHEVRDKLSLLPLTAPPIGSTEYKMNLLASFQPWLGHNRDTHTVHTILIHCWLHLSSQFLLCTFVLPTQTNRSRLLTKNNWTQVCPRSSLCRRETSKAQHVNCISYDSKWFMKAPYHPSLSFHMGNNWNLN